jgi:Uma2 family endonuclease
MSEALSIHQNLYAQLQALPEHLTGEIIAGELVVSPRPAIPHSAAGIGVGAEMWLNFNRRPGGGGFPGGWWILPEPELHLGPDVLVPDVAGWKRENLPILPKTFTISLAPDWVCEVLSPGTASRDKKQKARRYHAAGVGWYWLVDPRERTVEAYRREGEFWVQIGVWVDNEKARIPPFDAVELDLSRWWEEAESPV